MYYYTDYPPPLGEILIVSDGEAICGLWFYGQKYFKSSIDDDLIERSDLDIFKKAIRWLDSYFKGLNPKFDFKLDPQGSDFRLKV